MARGPNRKLEITKDVLGDFIRLKAAKGPAATLSAHLAPKPPPRDLHQPGQVECGGWATSSTFEVRASVVSESSLRSEQLQTASNTDAARLNGDSCPRMRRKPVGNSSNTG